MNKTESKIESTISLIRKLDEGMFHIPENLKVERVLLAAPGSYTGAPLRDLSAAQSAILADLGVVGANRGLTAHGANVRAQLDREAMDRDFPL